MNYSKKAFSFVELIIVISIIALLSVIGFTAQDSYDQKTKNAKVTTDLKSIENALLSYSQSNSVLPNPKGNNNFFKVDSSYAHDADDDAFGVYGAMTENVLPKKFINIVPLDPRTNNYYAYGKTIHSLEYELAGVNLVNGDPEAEVIGNYSGESGPYNLIRSYNGPNFVIDQSSEYLPYNPDERIITARINDFSGTVRVDSANADTEMIIKEGATITVSAGGFAEIYFSDGSISMLGGATPSKLTLSYMNLKQETNLVTDIKLALTAGAIWNKATSLDDDSEFEIYTTDSTAAVRGTIFGVEKPSESSESNIIVKRGKVEVEEVREEFETSNDLHVKLRDKVNIDSSPYTNLSSNLITSENDKTFIEVKKDEEQKSISTYNSNNEITNDFLSEVGDITNNIGIGDIMYTPGVTGTSLREIIIPLNELFKQRAKYLKLTRNDNKNFYLKKENWGDNKIIIKGSTIFIKYELSSNSDILDFESIMEGQKEFTSQFCKLSNYEIDDNGAREEICGKPKFISLLDLAYGDSDDGVLVSSSEVILQEINNLNQGYNQEIDLEHTDYKILINDQEIALQNIGTKIRIKLSALGVFSITNRDSFKKLFQQTNIDSIDSLKIISQK